MEQQGEGQEAAGWDDKALEAAERGELLDDPGSGEPEAEANEEEAGGAEDEGEILGEHLKAFAGPDGQLDSKKLAKAYKELNRKLGQAGSLKGEYDKLKQQYEQLNGFIGRPDVAAVLEKIMRGEPLTASQEQKVVSAGAGGAFGKRAKDAIQEGDIDGFMEAVQASQDAKMKALEDKLAQLEQRSAQEKAAQQQQQYKNELEEFYKKHEEDLFEKNEYTGEYVAKDQELYDAWRSIAVENPKLSLERALKLAAVELGRSVGLKKPKSAPPAKLPPKKTPTKGRAGRVASALDLLTMDDIADLDEADAEALFGEDCRDWKKR